MRPRVDLDRKVIAASVRDLAERPRDGSRSMGLMARIRADLGRDIHRRYRRERERAGAGFEAEVAITMTLQVDGFEARVRGRVDGVLDTADALVVEEVKSVALTGEQLRTSGAASFPDYALQARLYALALCGTHPGREIRVRLILVSVLDGTRREVAVTFDARATARELDSLLRHAIAEALARRERDLFLAECAGKLRFPYPELRPGQRELNEAIADGLACSRPVIAVAPTGTGKTACALFAGLRHTLAAKSALYFVTAKTTQQALVASTFDEILSASGLGAGTVTALTLRAKERMCPPENLLCHAELCPYLRQFSERLQESGVADQLVSECRHVDPSMLLERGVALELCPFELSLQIAARADLVICDYNYVYDRAIAPGFLGGDSDARPAVVIVDEAHNLADRAREYFSPFVERAVVADASRRLKTGYYIAPGQCAKAGQLSFAAVSPPSMGIGPKLFADLDTFCEELCAHIDRTYEDAREGQLGMVDGCMPVDAELGVWQELADKASRLMVQYAIYNRLHQLAHPRDPLMGVLREVLRMRDLVAADEAELVPIVAGPDSRRGRGVGIVCVNPARRLQRCHDEAAGTVVMSATLAPVAYFSDVLGLAQLCPSTVIVPSPFPAEHRQIVVVPTVSTTYRARARHYGDIARLIADVVSVRPGRYIAYFPSFAFLSHVKERLSLPPAQLLVQFPEMPEAVRRKTLGKLGRGKPPKLLLAVSGGIFAEGIDLPGDSLIGVIVVGPGLPGIGVERELMRRYYDERAGNGFAYAMLYPGMQRVIQSAGRVIRSMDDKGVIVLLGRRFSQPQYTACLPPDWCATGVEELVARDPVPKLTQFWAGFAHS